MEQKTKSKRNIKESIKTNILLQVQTWNISYHLYPTYWDSDSTMCDRLEVICKVILSYDKNIKVDDEVEFKIIVVPKMFDNNKPLAYGYFERGRKRVCSLWVPPSFMERFCFLIGQGIKPYFYITCEREKHETREVKAFSMESKITLDDYIEIS